MYIQTCVAHNKVRVTIRGFSVRYISTDSTSLISRLIRLSFITLFIASEET